MILKAIVSLILCASLTFGAFPRLNMKGDFTPALFEGYTVTLADGETVEMHIIGDRIAFSSSVDREYSLVIMNCEDLAVVRNLSGGGTSFSLDVGSYIREDVLYYLVIYYDAYGTTLQSGDNIIFKNSGRLHFWKSENYEFNAGRCEELWTDQKSLKECLEPQNDIECDDPVLISYSEQICEGAADDWEKAYRIYSYITGELIYDVTEAESSGNGYQDSAIDIIRDGKGVCEGFANVFVALCRAQGIPAVVQFGLGYGDYYELLNKVGNSGEYADHAWAAVYLGGKWHYVDPTYDISTIFFGDDDYEYVDTSTRYYLLPLEAFSNDHRIYDADTRHGVESTGSCGDNATYEITRDGVCHISGEGIIRMPDGVNGFNKVVFEPGSNITEIGSCCFCDCDLITTIVLPDTVKTLNDNAFNTCEDLEYVYLPEGLIYIGKMVFTTCDELSYIRVPDSAELIGDWAFEGCPRLYISVPSRYSGFADYYNMKPMYVESR